MILFPPAKINIGLYVVNRRPDGYHNIETLFYPVPLHDALEVTETRHRDKHQIQFQATGLHIEGDCATNLVVKAYHILDKQFGLPSVKVHLHKVIPMGAGLGGGSSDGASMLLALNRLFSLGLDNWQLKAFALQLGSDCPFFIEAIPAVGRGRGEELTPVPLNLSPNYLCIVKPPESVSTAAAYASVTIASPGETLEEATKKNPALWKERVRNVFEDSVFKASPAIGRIKEELYRKGALYASLSGSGSALFGLFTQPPQLAEKFPGCFVWEGQAPLSDQFE